MKRMLKRVLNIAAVLIMAAVGITEAQQQIDTTRQVSSNPEIEIFNPAGSVRVIGWESNEVRVVGTLGAATGGLEFESDDDDVEIYVEMRDFDDDDQPESMGQGWNSDLEIHVPVGSSVEIEAIAANVDVSGITGVVDVEAISGDVTVTGGATEIGVESTTGTIQVTASASTRDIDAETVSGSIIVTGASGVVSVATLSGSIRVSGGAIREGDFESTAGNIFIDADVPAGAAWDIENFNGGVEITIAANTSASFDVSTYSGDIDNAFGQEATRTSRYTPEKELEFAIGDGSAEICIETFSGSVSIRQR